MAIYAIHDQEPKFIFIINYKVMYSSLYEILPEYFSNIKFHNKNEIAKFKIKNYIKFSVVRNPFSRVVSAYYGKCIKSPNLHLKKENALLQYSQHQLLEALKIIKNASFEIIPPAILYNDSKSLKERELLNENFKLLQNISFEEYLECLSIVLNRKKPDGHFQKQYDVFDIPNQNPFYSPSKVFNNTNIIKLENLEKDWSIVTKKLGTKFNLIKRNKTDHIRPSFGTFYSDKNRNHVIDMYKVDFEKFDYPLVF